MATAFQPVRRSPLHHLHEQHHAQLQEENGWLVATTFTGVESELAGVRSSVGVCDWSHCGKVEIKGKGAAEFAKGLSLPGARSYPVHEGRAIVVAQPEATEAVARQLTAAAAGRDGIHAIPNTSTYATFVVAGPNSERVLRKLSGFNFTSLGSRGHAACSVALTQTLVIRDGDRFELHFPREFAEYLWETILDAGKEFHIHPFGTEALARW